MRPWPRGRIDIDAESDFHPVLQMKCERSAAFVQQRMRETVGLNRMISLEEQQRFKRGRAGGIPVAYGCKICPRRRPNIGMSRSQFSETLAQHDRGCSGVSRHLARM
jgi:hypothetical protein